MGTAYSITTLPDGAGHGPYHSEAEVADFVRGYVAEHGEDAARRDLDIRELPPHATAGGQLPVERFL